MRLPAHIRRGSGTGGRKPPRCGWPSGPSSDCRAVGRKYSQCQHGGIASPAAHGASSRSSVAVSARSGAGVTLSPEVSLRPIQLRRLAMSTVMARLLFWRPFLFAPGIL